MKSREPLPKCALWIVALSLSLLPSVSLASRRRPDYDGRGAAPTRAADIVADVPRVILAPLWLTLHAFRAPISLLLRSPVALHLFESASGVSTDLSTRETAVNRLAFAPTTTLDVGRRPMVGLVIEYRRWIDERNRIRAVFANGGERAFDAEIWDRMPWNHSLETGLRLVWWERPDIPVYGLPGTDGSPQDERRVWIRRAGGFATLTVNAGSLVALFVESGVLATAFDLDGVTWLASTQMTPRDSYAALATNAQLTFDTRGRGDTGVQVMVRAHQGIDLANPLARRWIVGEFRAGAYLAIFAPGRVLGVEAVLAQAGALGPDPVPFPELPVLGGDDPLNGFLFARIRGPSVAAVDVVYRWPIHVWLDAVSHVAVGGVMTPDVPDAMRTLHASWDIGIRSHRGGLVDSMVLFGLGSTPFDAPHFGIERARFVFALTRSF